jgi:hypothetical protein
MKIKVKNHKKINKMTNNTKNKVTTTKKLSPIEVLISISKSLKEKKINNNKFKK